MSEAKVRVSVVEGTIEIEGTESFVGAQLEKFGDSIRAGLAGVRSRERAPAGGGSQQGKDNQNTGAGDAGDLDDVFAPTETGVQILTDIPGDSNAQKMVNAAKLLAYGMTKLKGKDTILFEDVKATCQTHGCYDANNMAATLKQETSSFVFGGSGKKQTLKLTKPGTNSVEDIIQKLRGGTTE